MWTHLGEIPVKVKEDQNELKGLNLAGQNESTFKDPIEISSPSVSTSSSSSSEGESPQNEDGANKYNKNTSRELVLYDPTANISTSGAIEPVPESLSFPRGTTLDLSSRVLPSIGAFTVQCADCFKWRIIPTKEKYEEIREHILERPFFCETAREWRPDISCDDPADITQDGSRLWAIDKPSIAQPPPGWQRLLRIRGEGSTKFADVYYVAPSGKRLRSMVEIQKYLVEHPEYMTEEVSLARFSFQIPKPLQENYVRKRPARLTSSCNGTRSLESGEVNPLAWASPEDFTALKLGRPALPPPPSFNVPFSDYYEGQPSNKRAKGTPPKQMHYSNPPNFDHPNLKVESPGQS